MIVLMIEISSYWPTEKENRFIMARHSFLLLLLLLTTLLLSACGDGPTPTPPAAPTATSSAATESDHTPTAVTGGTGVGEISGTTTYSDGKPLANVKVTIRGTSGAGANTYFETEVDEGGHYALKVPDGLYEIKAYVTTQYNERTYGLWLDPLDGIDTQSQASADGIVKDFVWKVSGATPAAKTKPDSPYSYYGGVVEVGNDSEFEMQYNNGHLVDPHDYPEGSLIRMVFTPAGPLVDGSTGAIVEREVNPKELTDAVLRDIPLGDYTVSAKLVGENGEESELRVATIISGGNIGEAVVAAESAQVVFKPEAFGSFGVQPVMLYVLPGE
jgi:hypothetical protein